MNAHDIIEIRCLVCKDREYVGFPHGRLLIPTFTAQDLRPIHNGRFAVLCVKIENMLVFRMAGY